MSFCRVFPRLFAVCFVLSLFSLTTLAQQVPTRPRLAAQDAQPTTTTQTNGRAKLENDLVAAANGFFHASSHGVVYSRFDDYWTKRLNGFRRVPFAQSPALIASSGR